jgi:hypothetical protein
MNRKEVKNKVTILRKKGKTYSEINKILCLKIPQSTLSNWCNKIELSGKQRKRIEEIIKNKITKSREIALAINRQKRIKYLQSVEERVKYLAPVFKDVKVAKIALAMLYLGEGSKTHKGSLMLGNSDPNIIKLFLNLLRFAYKIDENKLRCTVQCRADQDINALEGFWSQLTKIPKSKFYKAQIDPRTIGKKSLKIDYKGVCRIDYFSGDLFIEIIKIGELLINNGPVV